MVEFIEPHNFSFMKPLGQNGSSDVFSEKWKGKFVAVKKFEGGCRQSSIPQFTKEVNQLGKLNNENLVKLIGYCDQRKSTYLVFEQHKGSSLFDFLQDSINIFTWRQGINMLQEIVNGMTYLHDNNVLHLDLKSSNIVFNKEKTQLKICDYGLMKISSMTSTPQSRSSAKSSSARWMSPEVRNAANTSKKSDVWSFGCILLEFATREVPFENMSDKAVVSMLENENTFIPVVYKNWLNTPSQIDALVAKCLKRDPVVRPFFTDMKNSLGACEIKLYEAKPIMKEQKSEISMVEGACEYAKPKIDAVKAKIKEADKLNENKEASSTAKTTSDILKFTIYDKTKYESSMLELDVKIKKQETAIKNLQSMLEIRKSLNATEKTFNSDSWDVLKSGSFRKLNDELDSIHALISSFSKKPYGPEALKSTESHPAICCTCENRISGGNSRLKREFVSPDAAKESRGDVEEAIVPDSCSRISISTSDRELFEKGDFKIV